MRLVLAVHALGPPVCTAADGAVEHASLGVARRAVVDHLHVVEVVAHAPALILPGGTSGQQRVRHEAGAPLLPRARQRRRQEVGEERVCISVRPTMPARRASSNMRAAHASWFEVAENTLFSATKTPCFPSLKHPLRH